MYSFLTTLVILLASMCTSAQSSSPVANELAAQSAKYPTTELFLFEPISISQKQSKEKSIDLIYQLNSQGLSLIQERNPKIIELPISFQSKNFVLQLYQIALLPQSYKINGVTSSKNPPGIFYRGIINGNKNSLATLSLVNGVIRGMFSDRTGNYEITPLRSGSYTITKSDFNSQNQAFECFTPDDHSTNTSNIASEERSSGDCLEVFLVCDFQSYQDNGNSTINTEAWALSMMNDVAALYANINIPIVVSATQVYTTPDPFAIQNDANSVLNAFVLDVQNNYTGRIAQLLSTRNLGGGISYGIGGICNEYPTYPGPYCVSASLTNPYNPFPAYSRNVTILAHEIGHVIGSRHTHACVWNGNNTQIDDCGNVLATNNNGTPEGVNCYDVNAPILPGVNGGTIMSFCDLLAGENVNFANGFGTQPGALLTSIYTSSNCRTGDVCATVVPGNNICNNAIFLDGHMNCMFLTFDNFLATPSGELPGFSCGNAGATNDVWFSAIVPSSGNLYVETGQAAGGLTNTVVQVYVGTCGNLSAIVCDDDHGVGNHAFARVLNQTPGDTIFIRVIDSGSNEEGIFDICVYDMSYACHPDRNALVDFYNATGGSTWSNNSGWSDGAAGSNCLPCTWYGVKCDYKQRVIEIDLDNNNLTGNLSSNLDELVSLRKFDLWNNNISGNIPVNIGNLLDMEYLDLSYNNFDGLIPISLGNLEDLTTLYLEDNLLTGNLPMIIGNLPFLNIFLVKNNNLNGCIPGTYASLCYASDVRMTGNVGLPGGGDFDAFCLDGTGGDFDADGFCAGNGAGDDCDDNFNDTYPGASEICDGRDNNCDGSTDEGFVDTNVWISGNGTWDSPASWSGGSIPLPCEHVIINTGVMVTIPNGVMATARSVTVTGTASLVNDGQLDISGSENNGISVTNSANYQNINILNITNISIHGIHCDGIIQNSGTIMVLESIGGNEVFLTVNGTLNNSPGSIITLGNQ